MPKIKKITEEDAREALKIVTKEFGVEASGDVNYRGGLFGRDSLLVADQLFDVDGYDDLIKTIILNLGQRMGVKYDNATEEEPNKIPHEWRFKTYSDPAIFARLAKAWQQDEEAEEFGYFGAVDATPLWVRLVGRYAKRDPAILEERVTLRDGEERSVRELLILAAGWILDKLGSSQLYLLEAKPKNHKGTKWHVLRDAYTAHIFTDGSIANSLYCFASVEVQGYAYDALKMVSSLVAGKDEELAKELEEAAEELQRSTIEHFWREDIQYFYSAIDRDPKNSAVRKIDTFSNVVGDFLATGLLDSLPDKDQIVEGVVSRLFAEDFLTDVGVRTMSIKHAELLNFVSYQGPLTVWPIMNQLFIAGLHKHGYHHLAEDLKNRMLNGLMVSGDYPELWYVAADGKVVFDTKGEERNRAYEAIPATNFPENNQAWTIGAVLYLLTKNVDLGEKMPLEEILLTHGKTKLWSEKEGEEAYIGRKPAFIDTKEGEKLNAAYIEDQGYPV